MEKHIVWEKYPASRELSEEELKAAADDCAFAIISIINEYEHKMSRPLASMK